ncbi:hypothetical protein AB0H34_44105 [Saccharopolyspora shandongensis]|uniref:hypothetical protein n=1 Tax=Saccharopolyspora shandongensis TaxID=418495 RepID=UPI0033F08DDE
MAGVNRMPRGLADRVYALSGISEAIPQRRLSEVSSDALAEWIAEHYPKRQYPVIFLGSSNGAAVHLAAALDAPWLPQTVLLPVRRSGVDRDAPRAEMAAGREAGRQLLDANPHLGLHHMHDPNQDRLMITGMSYFRVKWLRLPDAYRRFIRERLAPGGVVVSVECGLQWPVTEVAERHHFQFGALGGATEEEYHHGGARVADLLRRYGAVRRRWAPPPWDTYMPEAEWGFEESWLSDLEGVVAEPLRRVRFDHPERMSPVVAEVYRAWYEQNGIPTERLLFDCFLLVEPWWTVRTGSIPFWLAFNSENSLSAAHSYLDRTGVPDEIRLMLFSHGTESIGLAPIDSWEKLSARARKVGALVGVDRKAFPRDFAVFARAHRELARTRHLYPIPAPMPWEHAEALMRRHVDHTFSVEP